MPTLNLGVLISGRGSNLRSIIDAITSHHLDARIQLVISNRPHAKGLVYATQACIPTLVIDHNDYPDRPAFESTLVAELREAQVSWVVLAGFMRLLTPVFIHAFHHRIVNIHPSLLPAFPGTRAQRQALDHGVKVTGCTVHLVDTGVDTGPILAQAAVPVLDDDNLETLTQRLLEVEHQLLVQTLIAIAQDRVELLVPDTPDKRIRTRIARIAGASATSGVTLKEG